MTDLLAELTALETELHHPGGPLTPERLQRLLHPHFHEVGRSGRPYTRQVVVDYLASQPAPRRIRAWGHRLEQLAPDWALLHFRSGEIADDGQRFNLTLRSSLWHRGALGWQLYYHQGTPAAAD